MSKKHDDWLNSSGIADFIGEEMEFGITVGEEYGKIEIMRTNSPSDSKIVEGVEFLSVTPDGDYAKVNLDIDSTKVLIAELKRLVSLSKRK